MINEYLFSYIKLIGEKMNTEILGTIEMIGNTYPVTYNNESIQVAYRLGENMIREIVVKDVITYENPPDGEQVPIIDPYDGCTICCPYCFQQGDDGWNNDIFIKTNIPEMISKELTNWPKDKTIYIGSKCDPYMNLEEKYRITRQCIIELGKLKIPIMITTKNNSDIIFRDIDIMKGYDADFTILLGLSNLKELASVKSSCKIKNIEIANKLHALGINVWVFIALVLPGITDVDPMIDSLHKDIPVFLDYLRIDSKTRPGEKMISYITEKYPMLKETYEKILFNDRDDYFEELRKRWKSSSRVTFVYD